MNPDSARASGYVTCGAYECRAVIPDNRPAKADHTRTAHPDMYANMYLPCLTPEERPEPCPRG